MMAINYSAGTNIFHNFAGATSFGALGQSYPVCHLGLYLKPESSDWDIEC